MIIPVFVSKHKVRNASECEQNHTVKISIHVPTNRHVINYTVWYLFQHTHRLKNVVTKSGCCNFKDVMASGFKVKAWNN